MARSPTQFLGQPEGDADLFPFSGHTPLASPIIKQEPDVIVIDGPLEPSSEGTQGFPIMVDSDDEEDPFADLHDSLPTMQEGYDDPMEWDSNSNARDVTHEDPSYEDDAPVLLTVSSDHDVAEREADTVRSTTPLGLPNLTEQFIFDKIQAVSKDTSLSTPRATQQQAISIEDCIMDGLQLDPIGLPGLNDTQVSEAKPYTNGQSMRTVTPGSDAVHLDTATFTNIGQYQQQLPALNLGSSILHARKDSVIDRSKELLPASKLDRIRQLRGTLRDSEEEPHEPCPSPANKGKKVTRQASRSPSPFKEVSREEESTTASECFENYRREYQSRKRRGLAGVDEDIMFFNAQEEEAARQDKVEKDGKRKVEIQTPIDSEDEDSLFVSNKRAIEEDGENEEMTEMLQAAGEGVSLDERPQPKRARTGGKDASTDAQGEPQASGQKFQASGRRASKKVAAGLPTEGETSKKKRGHKRKTAADTSNDAHGKSKKKTNKGKGKEKGTTEMLNFSSLLGSNAIRDAQANANLPSQPVFSATRKETALRQLLASVPEERKPIASMDKRALFEATKKFTGHKSCTPDGAGKWKISGMKTSLEHYQVLGTAFMRERENLAESAKPHGGLCADGMGLGKTIMMLANIVNGRPAKNEQSTPTLIVATPGLMTQWYEEIMKHVDTKCIGQVLKYYGGKKLESSDTEDMMGRFSIILTTYNEIMKSYPKLEMPLELQTSEQKSAWWHQHFEENKGPLHRIYFRRVVLDEAQAIKNYKSRTSIACRSLAAKYRWALSGTPIMNGPEELYPYFKFLRVPCTGSYRIFRENYYGDNDETKLKRLQHMLGRFMIRRTQKDTLFGSKLLDLPESLEQTHYVEFTELERNVYDIVRKRMIARVNNLSRKNQLERNYTNILTMILRLRQLCGHVLLVEPIMHDLLEREDHERLKELAADEERGGPGQASSDRAKQIVQLRKGLAKLEKEAQKESHTSKQKTAAPNVHASTTQDTDSPADNGNGPLNPSDIPDDHGQSFGLHNDFMDLLKNLRKGEKWEQLQQRTVCHSCHNPPIQPVLTSCYHLYCKDCIYGIIHDAAGRGQERARCMECGTEFHTTTDKLDKNLRPIDERIFEQTAFGMGGGERRQMLRDEREVCEDRAVKNLMMNDGGGDILPSSKTLAIKALVMNWLQEDPDVKIIIYTQFVHMINFVARICDIEGWRATKYSGKMSFEARDRAIRDFRTKPELNILIASLKCGGIGLNLTMASRVINIDPWWNNAAEQQAFCRVFRMGQQKKTRMARLVVRGTIDQEMIEMQHRKQVEIDNVIDAAATRTARLSLRDLMQLFGGDVEDGEDGRPFIVAEDHETRPMANVDSEDEDFADSA